LAFLVKMTVGEMHDGREIRRLTNLEKRREGGKEGKDTLEERIAGVSEMGEQDEPGKEGE